MKIFNIKKGFDKGLVKQLVFSIVALSLVIIISFPIFKNYVKRKNLDQEIAGLEAQIAEYQQDNQELEKIVRYLKSEQSVEEKARLNLGLKKEGEEVVVIAQEDHPGSVIEAMTPPQPVIESSNPQKWLDYFLKKSD